MRLETTRCDGGRVLAHYGVVGQPAPTHLQSAPASQVVFEQSEAGSAQFSVHLEPDLQVIVGHFASNLLQSKAHSEPLSQVTANWVQSV